MNYHTAKHVALIAALSLGMCALSGTAFAEDGTGPSEDSASGGLPKPGVFREIKREVRDIRASSTEKLREVKREFRDDMRDVRNGSSSSTTPRELNKERRDDMRDIREERRGDIQDLRIKARIELAQNLGERMMTRFKAAIERIETLSGRIASRVEKMKTAGEDTTAAEAALASAKTSLDAARKDVAAIEVVIDALDASSTPKTVMDALKAPSLSAQNNIKAAHEALKKAVLTMRKSGDSTTQ